MEMFWACAVTAKAKSASARMMSRIVSSLWDLIAGDFNAKFAQGILAALARDAADFRVQTAAIAVHRHQQRAEAFHAQLPQRFRIEIIEVDILNRLDPGGLERRRAADDCTIRAAQLDERAQRSIAQATLADHQAHAVLGEERTGEALHAVAGRRAHAQRG